jgi:choline dehydrogenase-like flavoprotein
VKGLRVADMSFCPILTCNHTQINAYLIGERCAEMVVRDYVGQYGDVKRGRLKL